MAFGNVVELTARAVVPGLGLAMALRVVPDPTASMS